MRYVRVGQRHAVVVLLIMYQEDGEGQMKFYILMDHGIPNEVTSSRESYDKWLQHHDACELVECNTDQIFNERYQNIAEIQEKRIAELEKENHDFRFELGDLKRQASESENEKFAHGEKEYYRGIDEAITRLSYEAHTQNNNETYLKGYKEGTAAVFEIWDRVRAK